MNTAIVEHEPNHAVAPVVDGEIMAARTAQEFRVDSVARTLDAAMLRASTLEMTDAERAQLLADFPDEEIRSGAKGDNNLLYIGHDSIRRRLLEVFGPGKWSLIVRRHWMENLSADSIRVYAECVLVIRGCYCGEAIGAGNYSLKNGKMDYSDAAEAAQSEAFRRIAGKTLGVGLQVWSKSWCDGWKQRQRNPQAREERQEAPRPQPSSKPPSLLAQLERYDATLVKLFGIAPGTLVKHVHGVFAPKYGPDIDKWALPEQVQAKDEAKQYHANLSASCVAAWEKFLADDPALADLNKKLPELEMLMNDPARVDIQKLLDALAVKAGLQFVDGVYVQDKAAVETPW